MSSTPISPESEPIRAFVALDLDAASVRRIAHLSVRLREASGAPTATWIPPGNLHLTLKFLGDAPKTRVDALAAAAGGVVRETAPLRPAAIRVDGLPNLEHARVVVAAVADPHGVLEALARRIEDLGQKLGFASEGRAFRPHVTLARLKRPCDARSWLRRELGDVNDLGDVLPTCLVIYRSVLDSGGAQYLALARFEFTGEPTRS